MALCLFVASCAPRPAPRAEVAEPELVLVSRVIREGIAAEPSVGAETIELRVRGGLATIRQTFERLTEHGWRTALTVSGRGVAERSANGWLLDLELTHVKVRLSCVPVARRVHVAGARPVALCTTNQAWTGGERDTPGWWCDEVRTVIPSWERAEVARAPLSAREVDPVISRLVLPRGELFAEPPGVEHISQGCCGPDACDGEDGGWRMP